VSGEADDMRLLCSLTVWRNNTNKQRRPFRSLGSRLTPLHSMKNKRNKQSNSPVVSARVTCGSGADEEPVLIVIDMQSDEFPASRDERTIAAVEREIRLAVENGWGIVIVEFDPNEVGSTNPRLMRLVDGYPRLAVVSKSTDEGAKEIFEAIIENGFWPEHLRVCGCNSDACVLGTVQDYAEMVPSSHIKVIKDACNCLTGPTNDVWIEDFPKIPNVEIVSTSQSEAHHQ